MMEKNEAIEVVQELTLYGYDCRIKKLLMDPEYYVIVDGRIS